MDENRNKSAQKAQEIPRGMHTLHHAGSLNEGQSSMSRRSRSSLFRRVARGAFSHGRYGFRYSMDQKRYRANGADSFLTPFPAEADNAPRCRNQGMEPARHRACWCAPVSAVVAPHGDWGVEHHARSSSYLVPSSIKRRDVE